jgi:catecholate siderophore receptor
MRTPYLSRSCSWSLQLFVCIVCAGAAVLNAQSETQRWPVRGKVLDPAGGAIPGAEVAAVVKGSAQEHTRSTVSDGSGSFVLLLEPGDYTLRISKSNFAEFSESVHVGAVPVDLSAATLSIVPLQNTVQVSDGPSYVTPATNTATRTLTPLRDVPQTINVVTQQQIRDQLMLSVGDVLRYVPGVTAVQGENNRDQLMIRGNNTSADFFLNGVRDDVQYYRDLYNVDRVEVLKGSNAMIFGRGGGGGVVNRTTKEAGFTGLREIILEGGSFGNKRIAGDYDHPFNETLAFRLNGMYENSNSFRDYVGLERYGVNPTLTIMSGPNTKVTLGFENFRDMRTADRGIPSYLGRPADISINTFFGNPKDSYVRALANIGSAMVEHQKGRLNIRNRTLLGGYDRSYQNYVPGAVTQNKSFASLSAYDNATQRLNIFNQTDLTYSTTTGHIRHTFLVGAEGGRQLTDNFRNTGYFNNTLTSILVPYANPTIFSAATFRQSTTDANNHIRTNVGAVYAQDQVELSRYVQLIGGVRFDHFDLQYHNNRDSSSLRRIDNLISPRAGIVFKPITPVSIYASYSVSYLPSSGDQFSSLTNVTEQVKPEKFSNYEVGVKWDLRRSLSLTTAAYRLDRTNTRSTDPNDPTRIIQTGSQRANGYELGVAGSITRSWQVSGGYAYQDVFVTRATISARTGAQAAQSPHHMFSLWNNYQILTRLGAGLGILNRSNMFAAIDDSVVLPSYTRADAAVFYSVTEKIRLQANVENLFDRKYYVNADNNNNISPGNPRIVRVALVARF